MTIDEKIEVRLLQTRLSLARRALLHLSRREREAELAPTWDAYRRQSMRRNILRFPQVVDEIVELARLEAILWQTFADQNGEAIMLSLAIGMADAYASGNPTVAERQEAYNRSERLMHLADRAERGSGAPRAASREARRSVI